MYGIYIWLFLILCGGYSLNISSNATFQDFYWRDYIPTDIPYDAISVADGRYIGQVNHRGNIPANIHAYSIAADIEYGTKVTILSNIKILCSPYTERFYWDPVNFTKADDMQMKDAVKGGYQDTYNLYIGRTYHEEEYKVGKVIPLYHKEKGLRIWDKLDRSIKVLQFDLLKYNSTDTKNNCRHVFVNPS